MAVYNVQGPDGQQHQIEGPEGASDEQIIAAAHQAFGGGGAPAPKSAPSAQDVAFSAGKEAGAAESPAMAGVRQAAQQGTMGLSNYINAGVRYAGQRLTGVDKPDDYATDLAYSRGESEGGIGAHPVAGTVGGVAGTVMGGAAAKAALKATGVGNAILDAMSAKKGQAVGNVAKMAATGGAIGGGGALAEGQDVPDAAKTAALSAVAAPVAAKGAGIALNKLQPVASRAWQTMAETLGETPATLSAAANAFRTLTGADPELAQIVGLKSQGKLRDLAKANPTIAQAAMTAADRGGAPLHEQLQASQATNPSRPQTQAGQTAARDDFMDSTMQQIGHTPVHDTHGVLLSPHVEMALMPDTKLNARLDSLGGAGSSGGTGRAVLDRVLNNDTTLADVDFIRQKLRDQQSNFSNPSIGSEHPKNPEAAKEFGDMANKVEALGKRSHPDYGSALDQYRTISDYSDAFQHGLDGKSFADETNDTRLLKNMQGAQSKIQGGVKMSRGENAVKAGYEHGNALYQGQQALNAIAPGSVSTPDAGPGARHIAQGAAAVASGGLNSVIHGLRALPVVGDRLPEKVQAVIAQQLFNPKTTSQGIANLTRAGAQAKDMRQLAASIGGAAAKNISDYLDNKGQ